MSTLLIIDGNALMHRAYHAIPPFKTSKGVATNVVYGFFSVLHKTVTDYRPTSLVVCFDTPGPTFRNKLLATYQAQRPKAEDDFISQIPLVKEGLDAAAIRRIEKNGFEADDVIGTLAVKFKAVIPRVIILTGDKDIMQLVDDRVTVVSPTLGFAKGKMYDEKAVMEKLGVPPNLIVDYKALAGDPSDNYLGARGIGPKTAIKLLASYGTVNKLYDRIGEMKPGKTKEILLENRENVSIARKLATIQTDVPLSIDEHEILFEGFKPGLRDYFMRFEMQSLIGRFFGTQKTMKKTTPPPAPPQTGLFD